MSWQVGVLLAAAGRVIQFVQHRLLAVRLVAAVGSRYTSITFDMTWGMCWDSSGHVVHVFLPKVRTVTSVFGLLAKGTFLYA
jgi:hypothetical protein